MPELPEVETTRRGIAPHILKQTIHSVKVREGRLRWPVPENLAAILTQRRIEAVERRGKYLLLRCASAADQGHVLIHLGMSGSLRIVTADTPLKKHDHIEIALASGAVLRYHDPRRFGCLLWLSDAPQQHPLLAGLGPEPLSEAFTGDYLYQRAQGRKIPVKTLLMDSQVVVGVGNIYANESLFLAAIDPRRAAGRIALARYHALAEQVKNVLAAAIQQGGTTLRDFTQSDGQPGYFAQQLHVYGREGQPCPLCQTPLKRCLIAQRASYYCPHCQR